jgi:hypothetical protein
MVGKDVIDDDEKDRERERERRCSEHRMYSQQS